MLIVVEDERGVLHQTGAGHPESPARWRAVRRAVDHPDIRERVVIRRPRDATRSELEAVHDPAMLDRLDRLRGRAGQIDGDTTVSPDSVDVAVAAAGAGLTAVEELRQSSPSVSAAFCLVRPPGHHATPDRSMGFCLLNNVAVTAAALVAAGERVMIADFDVHHGNGTQDIFSDEPNVLFVSWHQAPLYPGTGAIDEIGGAGARGRTVNVPLPAGTTGDAHLETMGEVVGRLVDAFEPTWLLISAGFDAHRDDPLAQLALSSGDFAELTLLLLQAVPAGRVVAFLEGGYDLPALERSATATMAALLGDRLLPEAPTSGSTRTNALRQLIDSIAGVHGLS